MEYDDAFYQGILGRRRELGNTHGYVDMEACRRVVEDARRPGRVNSAFQWAAAQKPDTDRRAGRSGTWAAGQ